VKKKELDFIYKNLGEKFVSDLSKADIVKLNTNTVLEPEEIKIALQIVPRYILSFLYSHLKWKADKESCELDLPFAINGKLIVTKLGPDNYSGEIISDNKRVNIFKNRSLPSIGLLLMSSFELYDLDQLQPTEEQDNDKLDKLQELIDERFRLHSYVSAVIDQKITEKEALKELIAIKLRQQPLQEELMEKPKIKLKQFLERKAQKKQHTVEMDKNDHIDCPDCGTTLHKAGEDFIKCCICYGEMRNKNIKITKNQNGVKLTFPKGFDEENIEMLKDVFKK
jgi:hypothetical protein